MKGSFKPIAIVLFVKKAQNGVQLWMQKRIEEGPLKGKWEFPGGKVEAHERAHDAAKREVMEECGVEVGEFYDQDLFKLYNHQYEDRSVALYPFICREELEMPKTGQWLDFSFEKGVGEHASNLLDANHQIIRDLLSYEQRCR